MIHHESRSANTHTLTHTLSTVSPLRRDSVMSVIIIIIILRVTGTGSEAVAQMHDTGGCWAARQEQGWAEPSEAEAPGCPRSWRGRILIGRWSCPRTSCRRSDWSEWWCRPLWSRARPRSPARSHTARDNMADPAALRDGQKNSSHLQTNCDMSANVH